jgi:ribosome-associated protein
MVEQQYFEGFDKSAENDSRSAHKREAQALRKLIEKIANLGEQSFNKIILKDDVKAAILVARKLKANSDERRRQLQYVAKLQRSYPDDNLEEQFAALGSSSKTDPKVLRLERLREKLIQGDISVLNALCSLILDIDRNKLRILVKKAKEEQSVADMVQKEKPHSRHLYKFLKQEIARANVELPDELLK